MSCSVVGGQRQDGVSVNPGRKSDLGKGFVNGLPAVEIHRPKSQAQLLADAPRPTRRCDFIWKPCHKTLRITCSEGNLRQAKWAWIKDPKQAHIVDFRAQEPRVNEVSQQAGKGTWVPKQTQPLLGLVDQLEMLSRPSPSLVDQSGVASSSKVACASSSS